MVMVTVRCCWTEFSGYGKLKENTRNVFWIPLKYASSYFICADGRI